MFQAEEYPQQLRDALAPITAVTPSSHQGLYSFVTFATTALGRAAIKRAFGLRLPALRRERLVLDALRGSALPVPECLLYLETGPPQDAVGWLVMSRLPGEPLHRILRELDTGEGRAGLLRQLGQRVAQIHAQSVPPELITDQQSWLDTMLEQAAENLGLGLGEGSPAQLAELRQEQPAPVPSVFIHGDLFLDNVLTDGAAVTGLIDWAFGAAGDPRYDLALAMYGLTASDREAFLEGYGKPEGLSDFEMEFFLKLAWFF